MARRHGRRARRQRLRSSVPHGHWQTTTFVAGLRRSGLMAPMVIDGPTNREAFTAHVRHVKDKPTPIADWIRKFSGKKPFRLVSVALANKLARIAWSLDRSDR